MSNSINVVFALYPDITQLDFTGPFEVLTRLPGAHCMLAAVDAGDIAADRGLTFSNVRALRDIPNCDLLCVPGGFGTIPMLNNATYLHEIYRLGSSARYVTSVCTGSLLLAAAGLLKGKRAACHWAWREDLRSFGVTADASRVVRDGHVFTGGGVTAGIDMALTIMAEIAGEDYARTVQLALEYAPQPPFDCGTPDRAPQHIVAAAKLRLEQMAEARRLSISSAVERLRSMEASAPN